MNSESKDKINYTREYIVATGYIIFLCVLMAACIGFYYQSLYKNISNTPLINQYASNLPSTTPSPHVISATQFKTNSVIFSDDFTSNQNKWLDSQDDTKEKIDAGRLFFQSRENGNYSIISCQSCPSMETPYFLKATLSTNFPTDEEYGIVFKRSNTFNTFYLFIINPESKRYFLFHRAPDGWSLRLAGISKLIHSYPESNTLGLYANKDLLELYINEQIVDSYVESGSAFHNGFFGFYINDSWFGVYVDDIFVYEVE